MRKKASVVLAAVGVAAAAALFGGVLGGNRAEGTVTYADPAAAARLVGGFAPPGDTEAYVAELERRVAANPRDAQGLMLLGLAYQQRARETGDPGYYPRSEEALRRVARSVAGKRSGSDGARRSRRLKTSLRGRPLPGGEGR